MNDIWSIISLLGFIFSFIGAIPIIYGIMHKKKNWYYIAFCSLIIFLIFLLVPSQFHKSIAWQIGPKFISKSSSESGKRNYAPANNLYVTEATINLINKARILEVNINGGLWSQGENDLATIETTFITKNNCSRKLVQSISNQIPQNSSNNYKNQSLMKHYSQNTIWDCLENPNKIILQVDPGSYAFSIGLIEMYSISRISLLGKIINHFNYSN